jgi:hypothetical protein
LAALRERVQHCVGQAEGWGLQQCGGRRLELVSSEAVARQGRLHALSSFWGIRVKARGGLALGGGGGGWRFCECCSLLRGKPLKPTRSPRETTNAPAATAAAMRRRRRGGLGRS